MHVSASTYLDALFLLLGDNSDRSKALVKEFMDAADKDASKREIVTEDDELIQVYKSLIKSAISENVSLENPTSANMMLLRIRSNEVIKHHPVERDILTDVLKGAEPISAQMIDEYLKRLRNMLVYAEADAGVKKIYAKIRGMSTIVNADDQSFELSRLKDLLSSSLKSIEQRENSSDSKPAENYVSMSDPGSIKRALETYMERSVGGVIRTGLQGLNRALGDRGGIGRGETAVFAAPSHHFKSGILLLWLIWSVVWNTYTVKPGKKAWIYFISLENEVHQNLMIIFKALYTRVEKKKVDVSSMSTEFMQNWIVDYFSQFDIFVVVERYTPHEFTYSKFIGRYNHFTDLGYELVLFDLDYMSEARGVDPGDTMSAVGRIQMIAENYLKFVNHAKGSGYALTTGHQLTKEADKQGAGARWVVKRFNASMMADSSDVFRIVDILFYMYLEQNLDGHKFLTMVNRKNRGNMDTPELDKFFAYPFTEFGIEDDLDDLPRYTRDIDAWSAEHNDSAREPADSSMF